MLDKLDLLITGLLHAFGKTTKKVITIDGVTYGLYRRRDTRVFIRGLTEDSTREWIEGIDKAVRKN